MGEERVVGEEIGSVGMGGWDGVDSEGGSVHSDISKFDGGFLSESRREEEFVSAFGDGEGDATCAG